MTLNSPPLYFKPVPAGGTVTCRIFTSGGTSVGEQTGIVAIYANNSRNPLPLTFNSCSPAAPPINGQCAFGAKITGNFSFACSFTTASTQGANYTGSIELQASNGTLLVRDAMR